MSLESKQSMAWGAVAWGALAWSAVLIVLGVVALYSGVRFLAILVPAAIFVYFGTAASIFRGHHSGSGPSSGETNR